MGSGDNDTLDKRYEEFHGNIYHDSYYSGDIGIIPDLSGITVEDSRASGMHILVSGVSADVTSKLNLNLDYHFFVADKTPEGISKNVGSEINFIAAYELLENMSMIASANRFFADEFFKDSSESSEDVNYFYIQTEFAF
jgi:hypothetical protein